MDSAIFDMMRSGRRNEAWIETMINLEARKLIDVANRLSSFHLRDGLVRTKFVQEIKEVVERQFAIARRAKTDKEGMDCLKSLRAETENLKEQDRLLKLKTAQVYAKVEFVRKNNKIVGYVISAVSVVISGVAVIGGGIMIATMSPLGMFAGAILIADGINQISKELINLNNNNSKSEGIIADQAMQVAAFMGFTPKTGLAAYKSISLGAGIYSIVGLARKPEAWRLFRYIQGDFYRKATVMSKPKLTMKIAGYGIKAKVVFDLVNIQVDSNE